MIMNENDMIKQNTSLRAELNQLVESYNQLVAENKRLTEENARLQQRVSDMGWQLSPDRHGW